MKEMWLCGNSDICSAAEHCSHGRAHDHNGGCPIECSSFGQVRISATCERKYEVVVDLEEALFEI